MNIMVHTNHHMHEGRPRNDLKVSEGRSKGEISFFQSE